LSMQPLWRGNCTVLSTQVNYFMFFVWKSSIILIHSLWMKIFNFLWELFSFTVVLRLQYKRQ
jgi:hypothetical protein